MKFRDDRVELSYGINKTSYRTFIDQDGFLVIKVSHDNKQTRSFIRFHRSSPKGFLSHFPTLKMTAEPDLAPHYD